MEPAHEALLRQWSLLRSWLDEDLAKLMTLEGVRRAARDWEGKARDPAWLIHQAGRLEVAVRARGRASVILAFEGPGRARAQAVGEAAMDRLRRTAAGEALDGANCRGLSEGR